MVHLNNTNDGKNKIYSEYNITYDYPQELKNDIKIHSYVLTHSKGLKPSTTISIDFYGEIIKDGSGDFFIAKFKIFLEYLMILVQSFSYKDFAFFLGFILQLNKISFA